MKFNNVRTVIWDCDGTIWHHDPAEIFIFAKKLGITSQEKILELEKEFFEVISEYNERFKTEIVTHRKIIETIDEKMPILEYLGITATEFFETWKNIDTTILNPHVETCMQMFQKKGIKNIVYTDWLRDSQIRILKTYNLLQYIEAVYSSEGSYLKSSPKNQLSHFIKPSEKDSYLFIGDSISDIFYAKKAGINLVWYNPNGKVYPEIYSSDTKISIIEISDFKTLKKFFSA